MGDAPADRIEHRPASATAPADRIEHRPASATAPADWIEHCPASAIALADWIEHCPASAIALANWIEHFQRPSLLPPVALSTSSVRHCLLEFQSSNDYWMGLRMLRYICEFYCDLTKNFKSTRQKLPAVFPIMLYNGDNKWTAPTDISGLIEGYGIDSRFLPKFSYFKIAENEFPEEQLLQMKNAVAAIFYTENSDKTELQKYFIQVVELLRNETPEIIEAIEKWLWGFLTSEPESEEALEKFADIKESDNMLATAVKGFAEMKKQEGFELGLEKKALEDAKKLKAAGVDIETIVACIGVSREVVEKL